MLGRGSYGNVYEGTRFSDSRKGLFGKSLPQEVAMMVLLSKSPKLSLKYKAAGLMLFGKYPGKQLPEIFDGTWNTEEIISKGESMWTDHTGTFITAYNSVISYTKYKTSDNNQTSLSSFFTECRELICSCLERDPAKWIELEKNPPP
ncbi:hypothetical protein DPX16_4818 [Anabarilius grahami]|uniref:Protein kinase domain-containing protein n=1 Tax=Anabarilius grahami TaxID=495550 RepID=A0A3N0ZA93_ANAGA|nr:hypothetical protein DPX16_4818 [Anabarilius grahami]